MVGSNFHSSQRLKPLTFFDHQVKINFKILWFMIKYLPDLLHYPQPQLYLPILIMLKIQSVIDRDET